MSLVQEVKQELAQQIIDSLTRRNCTQTQAAEILGTQQPRMSDLYQNRLDKFSIDMLVSWVERLGQPIALNTSRLIDFENCTTGRPVRILLVEDNDDDVELLFEAFRRTRGLVLEVSRAETLSQAVALFSQTKFDAILLDLSLPDSDGVTTYKVARATLSSTIPIVVLTGMSDPQLPAELVGLGAENFLNKGQAGIGYQLGRTLFNAMSRLR